MVAIALICIRICIIGLDPILHTAAQTVELQKVEKGVFYSLQK